MQLVDEEDDVPALADLVHDRLDALFELAAVLGAGDHEGEVERDDPLVENDLGNHAGGNFLGEPFDDGRLPDAGLPDENGVVLRAAAEDLDDAADLLLAADDRVQFVFLCHLGKIAAEGLEGGGLDLLAIFLRAGTDPGGLRAGLGLLAEVGIQLDENFVAAALDIDVEGTQYPGGHSIAFAQQAQENVLGADVAVVERLGLLVGKGEHLLHPGGVGDVAGGLRLRSGADLLFDGGADGVEAQAEFLQDVDGDPLPEVDQARGGDARCPHRCGGNDRPPFGRGRGPAGRVA